MRKFPENFRCPSFGWRFFFPSQYILQSVRGHPAVVLTVTINGMQAIRPVRYLLFLSSIIFDWCLAPHRWGFYNIHNDTPHSVGLLWTSGQLVAETSTWQHTTLIIGRYPCPRRDSNPRSQQASGRNLRLRPRGHWDRLLYTSTHIIKFI